MSEKEKGRLLPIRVDGTESVPYIIKKNRVIIGRGDNCDIRVYVDGVESEHCAVLFNRVGEGFLDPLNKSGLTYLNGEIIEKKANLCYSDVITIVKRSFRFLYPSSSSCVRSYQSAVPIEDTMLQDFIGTDSRKLSQKEICQKRVTFGPTLSPEEFDKNLPPASPIRKGSLPGEKTNAGVRLSFKRNIFEDFHSDNITHDAKSSEQERSTSAVVLPGMSSTFRDNIEDHPNKDLNSSRPLFSDVLKKCPKETKKDLNLKKVNHKSSPRKLQKKTSVLQNSEELVNKSARHPRILAVGSTGHANSPETIIVCKKKKSFESSVQPDILQNEENVKYPSSYSSRTFDEENNASSHGSEDDLAPPASNKGISNHPSIDGKYILDNSERDDQAFSCISPNKLATEEENNICNQEENNSVGQSIARELLSSTSMTTAADGENYSDKQNNFLQDSDKQNNFLQDNAKQQFHSHSSISSAFNNESFHDISLTAVKKLALTISMMSAFHMYNKIMKDMINYSMYFPSTSFNSCNSTCGQRSSNHPINEGQKDMENLVRFQNMMHDFFSNSVHNKEFGKERCMRRSCRNNLNSETSSVCHRKKKKSNYPGCSPECQAICSSDNTVGREENKETGDESNTKPPHISETIPRYFWRQEIIQNPPAYSYRRDSPQISGPTFYWRDPSRETAAERNLSIKNPCQDSCQTSALQCDIKSSHISETSLISPSSTSEDNPNCLTTSPIRNMSTEELHECSKVAQERNVDSALHAYCENLNDVHNSFSDVSDEVPLIRKSFSPRHSKIDKIHTRTLSFINNPSSKNTSKISFCKKLRPRNVVAVKTKLRKVSLGVKSIGMASSRKSRAKRAKKGESCKTGNGDVKFCEDQSLKDPNHIKQLKIKKGKRKQKDKSVISERITRATAKEKNIATSKSVRKATSPVEKVENSEIAKGKNFKKVVTTKKVQAMRTNLKRRSLTSERITRATGRKRNLKNVPSTSDIVEALEENTESAPHLKKSRKNLKKPCKTTCDRSDLPKRQGHRLLGALENSKKRKITNNDENDISVKDKKNVKKLCEITCDRSDLPKVRGHRLPCASKNSMKRKITNDDENDISVKENNKKTSRKIKGTQVEISPVQRVTRSMNQKRNMREK